jgi:Fatty acid hydroxylase superfamily
MRSESDIRAEMKALGLRIKRSNFLAALFSGAFLVLLSLHSFPHSVARIAAGFVLGFFYANAFEYCLHRFLLHSGHGLFFHQHMVHHETMNLPEGARYVNFSRNPLGVVGLFFANAAPFLILDGILKTGWTVGMFAAFTFYYIAFEEIHWRTHMGGRLPKYLRFAARHHLLHHTHETGEYNVFLPICDWIVGLFKPATGINRDAKSQ